ncbi:hypothetical protein [Roseivirga sp. UBA838]|uniref:hypothetical protein n=1 Tax=Roseivirga sp. UBA838 TaxID=1947393 RepID=UPI00257F554F|nr:hypothetical protein [Roseivirga sp. UBA838]
MKRVILIISAVFLFFSASEMFAQRGRQSDRDRDRREDRREDVRRNDRHRDRDEIRDRHGRSVRVIDCRVYRDRGWRYDRRPTPVRNTRVYYDYDFRNGRRIAVRRGYRPSNRHIWVSGYWHYDHRLRRDIWIDGHWSVRRSHHRWVPGHYRVFNGIRIWVEGCWTVF